MLRIHAYQRFSTTHAPEGGSMTTQRVALARFRAAHAEWFADPSISAWKRPAGKLDTVPADIVSGKITPNDIVFIEEMDRAARESAAKSARITRTRKRGN